MVNTVASMLSAARKDGIDQFISSIPQEQGTILLVVLAKRVSRMGLPKWAEEKWTMALNNELMTRAQRAMLEVGEVTHG